MSVELKFDDVTVSLCTVNRSAFEGDGQDQIATVWLGEREIARLERHRGKKFRGFFEWHSWYECKWLMNSWMPVTRFEGGLLEFVSVVRDLA